MGRSWFSRIRQDVWGGNQSKPPSLLTPRGRPARPKICIQNCSRGPKKSPPTVSYRLGCSRGSHICTWQPPCPGRQVGVGFRPTLNVGLIMPVNRLAGQCFIEVSGYKLQPGCARHGVWLPSRLTRNCPFRQAWIPAERVVRKVSTQYASKARKKLAGIGAPVGQDDHFHERSHQCLRMLSPRSPSIQKVFLVPLA